MFSIFFWVTRIDMIASFDEYSRIMIWNGLDFEHFKNLEGLENLKNLDNRVLWTFWELTCSFRSILLSDLGLDSFDLVSTISVLIHIKLCYKVLWPFSYYKWNWESSLDRLRVKEPNHFYPKSKHLSRWLKWRMIWLWYSLLNLTVSADRRGGHIWK